MKMTLIHKWNIILFVLTSFLFVLGLISCGSGGDSSDQVEGDKFKSILLKQKEWKLEWNSDKGYSGEAYLTFEDRGNKFVAKIDNRDEKLKCNRKVTFTSEGFKMAGCRQTTVPLIYDPNDQRYPFKGDIPGYTWKFRAL